MTPILQANPRLSYLEHQAEIDAAVQRVLSSGGYVLGAEGKAFECELASYLGAPHAVGVASGTDALELALRVCGVASGQPVYTVAHTAVATVVAITRCGARPVLVDIEPKTYTMDVDSLREALRQFQAPGRGGAILPVHLYGQAADMPRILELARRYRLPVVEDCAQAHGARLQGRTLGNWGDAAAFSFYPTKNLGAMGDGGAVVTQSQALAERVRSLREYGWRERHLSAEAGINSRLDELQAAILRVKLPHLAEDNARRRAIAARYDAALAGSALGLPGCRPEVEHVYHQYVVRMARREPVCQALQEAGVGQAIHYPQPIHRQPAYVDTARVGSLAHAEAAAASVLSLPLYPQLGAEQVEWIAQTLRGACRD